MAWPQITMIVLLALSLGVNLADHGKPKDGEHNFTHSLVSVAIFSTLLYCGGFFS